MSLILPNIIVVHKPIKMIQNHKLAPNFNVVENIDYPHYNHQPKALQKKSEQTQKSSTTKLLLCQPKSMNPPPLYEIHSCLKIHTFNYFISCNCSTIALKNQPTKSTITITKLMLEYVIIQSFQVVINVI
jgi:hypothetical protein